MDVAIVTLDPNDWELYKTLRLQALQEEPQAFASTYAENVKNSDESWRKRLEDAVSERIQWMVFAKCNEQLIGMASAFLETEGTVHIGAMYVVSTQRGKGISNLLMNDLLTRIKKNKEIHRIIVDVNAEQLSAYNLYKNSGFVEMKKYKRMLGDDKEHDIIQLEMNV